MGYAKSSIKLSEIMNYIETLAPRELQEGYDNSGLILGNPNTGVARVLVCLDVCLDALETAISKDCQLIVSHHPAIFKAIKVFTEDTREGELLVKAVTNHLAIYSAHTNFTDLLCKKLGLKDTGVIQKNLYANSEGGFGRYGTVDAIQGKNFIKMLKMTLSLPAVRLVGYVPESISKVAVYNGAYDRGILNDLKTLKPDVLVTGDLKYHDAQELAENSLFTIDAGHYGTEKIFAEEMSALLKSEFPHLGVLPYEGADIFTFA